MRTIAVLNQKGGVGKTTTVANVAAALAAAGQKVIAIDLDPQAHLTIHLGAEPQAIEAGAYEVLTQSADFGASLMLVRPNLWLLAANINLVGAETELVNVVGREIILREAMQASQNQFDFCLIDCPPSLSVLSLNALAAAQEVLIPLQPHFLALQGFGKLLQTVDLVNKRINPHLKVAGVLLCMHDTRASLSNEVRADIDRFLQSARGAKSAWSGAEILPTFIRRNIKLAEAPSYGQTIFEYDPDCNGAEDYGKVARYLLGIEEPSEPQPDATNAGPGASEQAIDPMDIPPVAVPTPAPADAPAEAPTTDAVYEAQENDPPQAPPADASEELSSGTPVESPLAAEPPTPPDDDDVDMPPASPAEVPTTDPASEIQEDNPREIPLADASPELPPAAGSAEPSPAPEPPEAPYNNRMETPPTAPEWNESPASAASVDAPPEPQADRPAQSTPAVPPIPIVTVNPLVPQCYNPVPIWPEPATSSSATPNRQVAFPGKQRRHSTRPILLLSSWIRWILSYSNPLRVIRPSAAPLLSPAED